MNEIIKNIITRRSVRNFSDREIPREILEEIITAGLYAPSAMNTQPWQLTVVTDNEKLVSLQKAIAKELDRPDYHRFYNAPVLVIVSVPADYRHGIADTGCVLENIFLAAHSTGVGSVWINQLKDACDTPEIRKVLDSMGVPSDHVSYGCAALGYAGGEVKTGRENKGIVRWC